MFAVATDLYYRIGPAAAEVLARSDTARALVRRLLGPVGAASQAAVGAGRDRARLTRRRPVEPGVVQLVVDNPRADPYNPCLLGARGLRVRPPIQP